MKHALEYEAAALKARGIMKQKQADEFAIRLRVVGGRLDATKLGALAGILTRYRSGHVHLTIRQGIEIPNVRLRDVEDLCSDLAAAGLSPSPVGPCVRSITACQGLSCGHGMIDAQGLAQRIDERMNCRSGLPHKFKIGVTGCPNGCIKPCENDLGIMGIVRKAFREELCDNCGFCVRDCSSRGALIIEGGSLIHHPELCLGCGKCVAACPHGAWESVAVGYALFAGGKMGKQPKLGQKLALDITDEDQVLDLVHAVVTWYAAHGEQRERFGDTLDRVGIRGLTAYLRSLAQGRAKER
jgi:anaerobic sulfite reductase subunit C